MSCFCFLFSCNDLKKQQTREKDDTDIEVANDLVVVEDIESVIEISALESYLNEQGLLNIRTLDPSIKVDLKYATTDNFTKTILYDSLSNAYLHPKAADKLIKAQILLKEYDSNLSLFIYDAARPMSVQKKMYAVVQNTPYHAYVANPSRTGMHNYGMAVDLTICTVEGMPLDMGTPFDYFGAAAGINKEDELVSKGVLTTEQIANRRLLRRVMTEAGFIAIRGEWWHFNASTLEYAKNNIPLIE